MLFGSKKKNLLALDLGFNHGKQGYEVEVERADGQKTPELKLHRSLSVVRRRSETAADLATEGTLIGLRDGSQWEVGAKGFLDKRADRLTHTEDIPKYYAMLGRYHEETGVTSVDYLITGLPIAEYMARKDELKEAVSGVHEFEYNNQRTFMNVKDSMVLPQSAGAYMGQVLTPAGRVNTSFPYLTKTILTLDIGGKSTDGCVMKAMKYDDDASFTIYEAMIDVQKELNKLLMKEFRYSAMPYELDAALQTKRLELGGERVDVSHLIDAALETRFPYMASQLSTFVDDFRRFGAILLVGGGAYSYSPYIQELVGDVPVIIADKPEYANVIGYLYFAKMKLAQQPV